MKCFIVLYLIYVIYYACRFEKLLAAYVVLLKNVPTLNKTFLNFFESSGNNFTAIANIILLYVD